MADRLLARVAMALAIAALGLGSAHAACLAPSPPDTAQRPAKPTVPVKGPCVDAKPGTQGCLGWEGYSYNDAVNKYNTQLPAYQAAANAYVTKLNAYVQASADYAKCEVETLR